MKCEVYRGRSALSRTAASLKVLDVGGDKMIGWEGVKIKGGELS